MSAQQSVRCLVVVPAASLVRVVVVEHPVVVLPVVEPRCSTVTPVRFGPVAAPPVTPPTPAPTAAPTGPPTAAPAAAPVAAPAAAPVSVASAKVGKASIAAAEDMESIALRIGCSRS